VKVSWFQPQNQTDYSLSVASQNRQEDEHGMWHALRSSGLLHLEASQARVFKSHLKTGGGATRMMHVTSSWKLHQVKAEHRRVDVIGYGGPFYPNLPFSMY
jgi:hypothetical protein